MNLDNEREAFLYELNGHGYHFKNTDWHEDWERFEDEQLNMVWEMWLASANREGYKLVLVEPTERMLDSAYSSISDNLHYADLENIYTAMINSRDNN